MSEDKKRVPAAERSERGALRAHLLQTREPEHEMVTLFGKEFELRQPTLEQVLNARDSKDALDGTLNLLIDRAFVPGTNERIFEEGDKRILAKMPFGKEMVEVNAAMSRLSGIDLDEEEEKALKKTQTA